MASLRNYTFKLGVGEKREFGVTGNTIRVISTSIATPIYFETDDNNSAFYLTVGEQADFEKDVFNRLDIFHNYAGEVTITIAVGKDAQIGSAKVSGEVIVSNIAGSSAVLKVGRTDAYYCSQQQKTVTNASGILQAGDTQRRGFIIQNKHDTGNIWIVVGGVATQALGFLIPPMSTYTFDSWGIPQADFHAIGDVLSNDKVVTLSMLGAS